MEYGILAAIFLLVSTLIGRGIVCAYRQKQLFHLLFSLIYGVIFLFGVPFSSLLAWQFAEPLPDFSTMWLAFVLIGSCYGVYWLSYAGLAYWLKPKVVSITFAKQEVYLTACLLLLVSLISLAGFIYWNGGLLLFELEKYRDIFSSRVNGVALKRFFYFFIPALLLFFLLKPSKKNWWLWLMVGVGLGFLNYLAVGGTRANIALVVMLFVLLGWHFGYVAKKGLMLTACVAIVAMFALALWRYGLVVSGREAWFTFLYLTRDTFSPWHNFAQILASKIDFQGVMPIVRDFYVYIPQSWWAERPDIVWNSANYFTKVVLGNQSGLAISPTLLGGLYIMGGYPALVLGSAIVGGIIRQFDRIFEGTGILGKTYCLANVFNFIVLVREGLDAFVSRWVFFSAVFLMVWGVAKCLYWFRKGRENV